MAFGFPTNRVGENAALAFEASAEKALQMWKDSPGHDANQRRPDYQVGAAGVACKRFVGVSPFGDDILGCQYVMMFGILGRSGSQQALPSSPPPAPATSQRPAGGGGGRPAAVVPADPCAGHQAAPPPAERSVHRVEPGETLSGLAQRYLGDPSRYCDLAAWSGISAPYLLRVGQEVVVPAQAGPAAGTAEEQGQTAAPAEASGPQLAPNEAPLAQKEEPPEMSSGSGVMVPDRLVGEMPVRSGSSRHPVLRLLSEIGRRVRELWPF